MNSRAWVQHVFWVDGIAALSAGVFVLALREVLAERYALPLGLVTLLGLVNLAYAPMGLTLARWRSRPRALVVALSLANGFWTLVCVALAVRFAREASALGLAHLVFEGAFVAALAAVEWRNRSALVR